MIKMNRRLYDYFLLITLAVLVVASHALGQQIDSYKVTKQLTNRVDTDQSLLVRYLGSEFGFLGAEPSEATMDSLISMLNGRGDEGELTYYLGWSFFALGQIPEAFTEADRYAKFPAKKNAYGGKVLLAKLYAIRGSPVMAERLLDEAIAMKPDRIDAYIEKAGIYAFGSDIPAGLADIKRVVKRFPVDKRPLLYRGILSTRSRDFKGGLGDIREAMGSGLLSVNELWLANYWAGTASIGRGEFQQALDYAQQCLMVRPEAAVGLGLRGEAYFRLGSLDLALADFEKMVESVKDSYYWEIIASIYETKGDIASACSYYEQYCQLFPNRGISCSKVKKLCKH